MTKPIMHCQAEIERDLGYDGVLPDSLMLAWFRDRYSISKHLLTLYSLACGVRARNIVEIGFGRSSFVLAKVAHENNGSLTTCDIRDFSYLFSDTEKSVTQYVHGTSDILWAGLPGGIDFAFLDHFSDESIKPEFVISELSICISKLKSNGIIAIHDSIVSKYCLGSVLEEFSKHTALEICSLPYNYGLAVLRFKGKSSYGTIFDEFPKKYDDTTPPSAPSVLIPSSLDQGLRGGPKTFITNIRKALNELRYPYFSKEEDVSHAKGVFFPISYDIPFLKQAKQNGAQLVQRLDGVYYPSQHGPDYKELNRHIHHIYSSLADVVVFQSYYSKQQCQTIMGNSGATREFIIPNGADPSLFYSNSSQTFALDCPIFVTTGHIRNEIQIRPVVESLDRLSTNKKLLVAGRVDKPLRKYLNRDYITYHESLSLTQIGELLRSANVFVFSFLNPNCPNSVIEAIATGLPIVGFDSGCMEELCSHSSDLLAPVSDDIIQMAEDFSVENLAEKIALCLANYGAYRERSLENVSKYSLREMAMRYIEVFNGL